MKKFIVICSLVTCLLQTQLLAECNQQGVNFATEHGIQSFFTSCKRKPKAFEYQMFTWGHKEKFKLLNDKPYHLFALYNIAQQDAYAGAHGRKGRLTTILKVPATGQKFIVELKSVYGTANIGELFSYTYDSEILLATQNRWQKLNKKPPVILPLKPDGTVDLSKLRANSIAAREGFRALAFEQLHPGFIADLNLSIDEHIKQLKKQIKKDNPEPIDPVRGKLLGFERSKTQAKPSNISFSPALYFAVTPFQFVRHYYNAEHEGYVCNVDNKTRITDITDPPQGAADTVRPQQMLLENNVYLRLPNEQNTKAQFPSDYNELTNPRHFRTAMQGKLLRYGHIYADNGVIDFSKGKNCRAIELRDFASCEGVFSLSSFGNFYGEGNKGQPLYDFLLKDDATKSIQLDRFLDRFANCADANLSAAQNTCKLFADGLFLKSILYKQNKKFFDDTKTNQCQ